jgi:hypothetical protein
MRKTIPGTIALVIILAAASCSKTNTPSGTGSWTFKSVNYTATSSIIYAAHATSTNSYSGTQDSNTVSLLNVFFSGSTFPTAAGTYTVSGSQGYISPGTVALSVTTGGPNNPTTYWSTGGNGTETVKVSVSSAGQLTVSGTSIEMNNVNTTLGDSAALLFTIAPVNN